MRRLFADTIYLQGLLDREGQWHRVVKAVAESIGQVQIVTTQEVLVEVLAGLRGSPYLRDTAVAAVSDMMQDPDTEVILQSEFSFQDGLELYSARRDKTYSLTDCISMRAMRRLGISEALTNDDHFEQEGFVILIKKPRG
jgi:uncharacterized protein